MNRWMNRTFKKKSSICTCNWDFREASDSARNFSSAAIRLKISSADMVATCWVGGRNNVESDDGDGNNIVDDGDGGGGGGGGGTRDKDKDEEVGAAASAAGNAVTIAGDSVEAATAVIDAAGLA